MSAGSDYDSYIPLVPLVSLYFMYDGRARIFTEPRIDLVPGVLLFLGGAGILTAGNELSGYIHERDVKTIQVLGAVIAWIGVIVAGFGRKAALKARFPVFFLFLAVPMPQSILDAAIALLQRGSAELSWMIFKLSGAPVQRESAYFFNLPGLRIEVAEECSGIRSSLALVITTIVAGQVFLKGNASKALLVLASVPIAILKNSLRIAALTFGGYYLDPQVLTGPLHNRGGVFFFILGLALLSVLLMILRRTEKARQSRQT